ncbi:hypothetical protein CC78DRAFT_576369 [Lojkania enalia]|uniref:Clr5 domain-containing protein n=1 Tax=Lojkania enalia TaxID=147567 RepID=A0A9P4KFU0_9PLEO|nr:hypothetical protein CC78DRAFT_576369 [Didymosphaeria enalia]
MVYSWDGKEEECYRLYVSEKRSLDEVMGYWEQKGFTPSKRAFQTQFRLTLWGLQRWNFPSKRNAAHKNEALVARVKELWGQHVMHKDMGRVLREEGWSVGERELLRLRLRFGWLLRERRGVDGGGDERRKGGRAKNREGVPGRGSMDQLEEAMLQGDAQNEERGSEDENENAAHDSDGLAVPQALGSIAVQPMEPEELERRQARLEQLQLESDEKWRTRKRRRRTKGWAGLPADAPEEPPRFPSETTLDEAKAYLSLDNQRYCQVREQFSALCETYAVAKKSLAGPDKWTRMKEELIQENAYLANVFQQDPEARQQLAQMTPNNSKAISLDVICMDVTKRLRTSETRMGLAEAKNLLGFNPDETRQVRNELTTKLHAAHFNTKLELGNERWNEIKQAWLHESELLTRTFSGGETDPKYAEKLRAVDMLSMDVMKRVRYEKKKYMPAFKPVNRGPGPGPAPRRAHVSNKNSSYKNSSITSQASNNNSLQMANAPDLQIDPSLLLAVSDPSLLPTPLYQTPTMQTNAFQTTTQHTAYQPVTSHPQPVYFRLHPHSSSPLPNKTLWLSILQSGTLSELKQLAMREHPGTTVLRVEGLMVWKGGSEVGISGVSSMDGNREREREIGVLIEREEELRAYLEKVRGGKASFLVLMGVAGGYV